MTTKRQIRKLVAPVLERHPDLAAVETRTGLQFVLKPFNHLNRGFMIWPSSNADLPNYHWFAGYTFSPRSMPYGPYFDDFRTSDFAMMKWSHPRHQEAFTQILEAEILPTLKSIDTINKLFSLPRSKEISWKDCFSAPIHKLRLLIASGQFEIAGATVLGILAENRRVSRDWSERIYVEMIEQLWPLVQANERPGVAAMLHDWERQFVEEHGLQSIYVKEPFPFEYEKA